MQKIVSEQPERFFVAELIREKIFLQYDQEIPYSVQVGEWVIGCWLGGRLAWLVPMSLGAPAAYTL
jgi:hypothetical protein